MRTTLARLKEKKGDEGFTLIELLIVIIILAILATIVIFAVGTTTKNAALAACQSTVKEIQTALEAYKAQNATGHYPATLAALATPATTNGPWLKTAPHTSAGTANATLKKYGWVFTSYSTTTGKFTVLTKGTTSASKPTTTATVCKGA